MFPFKELHCSSRREIVPGSGSVYGRGKNTIYKPKVQIPCTCQFPGKGIRRCFTSKHSWLHPGKKDKNPSNCCPVGLQENTEVLQSVTYYNAETSKRRGAILPQF